MGTEKGISDVVFSLWHVNHYKQQQRLVTGNCATELKQKQKNCH